MPDLRASRPISDEIDGLDESVEGVPEPNTASEFTADYALPTVVPKHVRPLAVVALILAFTVPVVAIPLGHRVLRRLQHEGGRGRGLAQAAIVIGYLVILLLALIALNVVVAVFLHRG